MTPSLFSGETSCTADTTSPTKEWECHWHHPALSPEYQVLAMEGQTHGESTAGPVLQEFFPQGHQYWTVTGGGEGGVAGLSNPTPSCITLAQYGK